MEPENDLIAKKDRAESWKRQQDLREAARAKCYDACEAGDIDQLKDILTSEQLNDAEKNALMRWAIDEGLLEPTRCLLEHEADPKMMPLRTLGSSCRSLEMFKLLAEFGINYKSDQDNILMLVYISIQIRSVDLHEMPGGSLTIEKFWIGY